ncbi:MAG: hypothetical protein CVU05_07870 [Bacteroidetes bacterium HGW-Bacteroidetes-21]|nr:MAG: hypothetical protein CVU05_07870 [Bacteroidetes bacterium HGW-Bacteroidetes-21]
MSLFAFTLMHAQTDSPKKLRKVALEFFNNEEYQKALPVLLKMDSIGPDDFEIKYYIGACYLNSNYEQVKGIPYLEYALKNGEASLPKAVFLDLGRLYHLNYQFDEAVHLFERYIKLAEKSDYDEIFARRMIQVCKNAKTIISDSISVDIMNLGMPVNTSESEVLPLISADEHILFFARHLYKRYQGLVIDTVIKIMCAESVNGKWSIPKEVMVPESFKEVNLSLAGISPDGQTLFLSVSKKGNADLYYCRILDNVLTDIKQFSSEINSEFDEHSCSMTPDGQILYFSSNRPGGYGGYDIYRSILDENGQWQKPENLGLQLNTDFNEDCPFIHPDKKTLFFSSEGHMTLGGFDIFQTVCLDEQNNWSIPKNAGFPINTTYNDLFFSLSADGNNAYFSSAKGNIYGNHDIFKVTLHESIPLTLVKGSITGGTPSKPVKSRIRVVDRATGQKLKYIYNPNPKTGKYLMIFPPNKDYDMIIEAEGYYPYLINISVPDQTYFYELFQEIHLDKVMISNNKELGQEITVKNVFYDLQKKETGVYQLVDTAADKRYEKLLGIVENIIETSDSLGQNKLDEFSEDYLNQNKNHSKNLDNLLNMIENAIETTDSSMLMILDQTALYHEKSKKVYFYDAETRKPEMSYILIDGDTLYTLPSLNTKKDVSEVVLTDSEKNNKEKVVKQNGKLDMPKKLVYEYTVYFDPMKSDLSPEHYVKLGDFIQLMADNSSLIIEIYGFTDTRGEEKENLDLSKDRALSILKFFLDNFVQTQRMTITGFGESKSAVEKNDEELRNNRRAEVKLYELSESN